MNPKIAHGERKIRFFTKPSVLSRIDFYGRPYHITDSGSPEIVKKLSLKSNLFQGSMPGLPHINFWLIL